MHFHKRIGTGPDEEHRNKPSPDGWPAYNSVQRWTRNKNVFDKRFIIVPINEQYVLLDLRHSD